MTVKIDRSQAIIRLSGKLRSEHLEQIHAEIQLCETADRSGFGGARAH
jgi:hypothetical protein